MNYELAFHPKALKEWKSLDSSIKILLKKKLAQRLTYPKIAKDKLQGYESIYKIKLQKKGFRLVYEVRDKQKMIFVIVVNKREDKKVYDLLRQR